MKTSITFSLVATSVLATGTLCAQTGTEEKPAPLLDVQIVPVGPVPIAVFENVRVAPKKSNQPAPENGAPGAEPQQEETKAAPSHDIGLQMVVAPEDETPPTAYYVKLGEEYQVVNCNLNSLGTPIRIQLSEPNIAFYSMKRDKEGKEVFKKEFTYEYKPGQDRLLVTLSKPLKSKKWDKPRVDFFDTSDKNLSQSSALMINIGSERVIGGIINKEKFNLRPYSHLSIPNSGDKGLKFELAASPDGRTWGKTERFSVAPGGQTFTNLLLTYPVTDQESFRGFKTTRGKIEHGKFKKAPKYIPSDLRSN